LQVVVVVVDLLAAQVAQVVTKLIQVFQSVRLSQ
jgi:hypothetical protein